MEKVLSAHLPSLEPFVLHLLNFILCVFFLTTCIQRLEILLKVNTCDTWQRLEKFLMVNPSAALWNLNHLQLPQGGFDLQASQPCGLSAVLCPHCINEWKGFTFRMFGILSRHNFAESIFTCNLFSSEAVKWQTFPGFLLKPEPFDCLGRSYPYLLSV